MVIAVTLMITVVCLMFVGALTQTTSQDLGNTGQTRDRVRALELAKSGLNHTLHVLSYNQNFVGTIQQTFDSGEYFVSFDPSTPAKLRSVNRLSYPGLGIGSEEILGVTGQPIYARQTEIVSQGKVGRVSVRLRSLATTGFSFNRSIGCAGSFSVNGTGLVLGGVQSLASQAPADGGIYCTKSSGVPVQLNGVPMTFSAQARIETAAGLAGVSGLAPANNGLVSQLSGNSKKIPEFEVGKIVDQKLLTVSAQPREIQATPGGFSLPDATIDREYAVNGNLVVNGDLNLTDGTLYVKGDLLVNGGIMGVGSVFADGKVTVNGGTSVLSTNQGSGAAVFASSDVTFQGQSAAGYLNQLSTTYPSSNIASATAAYQTSFNQFRNEALLAAGNPASFSSMSSDLVSGTANLHNQVTHNYFINPIPGPSGLRSVQGADGPIPSLVLAIVGAMGPAYAGDVKAQKVVRALVEEGYYFRRDLALTDYPASQIGSDYRVAGHMMGEDQTVTPAQDAPHWANFNVGRGPYIEKINSPAGTTHNPASTYVSMWDGTPRLPYPDKVGVPNPFKPGFLMKDDRQGWEESWCDSALPSFFPFFRDMTIDHQHRILTGTPVSDYLGVANPSVTSQLRSSMLTQMRDAQRAFVTQHPADLSWLSRSAFQGLVYSGGNVLVDGEFEVQGAVLSHGDVTINAVGPCKLIYNQEYFRTRGAAGPVTPVSVQQL